MNDDPNGADTLTFDQTIGSLALSALFGAAMLSAPTLMRNGWSAVLLLPVVILIACISAAVLVLPVLVFWPRMRLPSYPVAAIWGILAAWIGASVVTPTLRDVIRWEVLVGFGSAGGASGVLYSYLAHRRMSG